MGRASVRTRLALWYAGILAATLALLGGLAYVILEQGLHRDVDQSLMTVARSAADWAARREGNFGQPSMEELVRELFGASPFERFLQLLDPGGHPLAMSPNVSGRRLPPSEEALTNATLGLSTYETVDLGERHPVRLLTYPVMERGRAVQLVRVAISLEAVAIVSVPARTWQQTLLRLSFISFNACNNCPVSSVPLTSIWLPKSPAAIVCATSTALRIGRVIEPVIHHPNTTPIMTAIKLRVSI